MTREIREINEHTARTEDSVLAAAWEKSAQEILASWEASLNPHERALYTALEAYFLEHPEAEGLEAYFGDYSEHPRAEHRDQGNRDGGSKASKQ